MLTHVWLLLALVLVGQRMLCADARVEQVGYRCASEPIKDWLKKGGEIQATEGRKCLCNGLMANAGHLPLRHPLRWRSDMLLVPRVSS
eukprot:2471535-Rhodomonas_salina.2